MTASTVPCLRTREFCGLQPRAACSGDNSRPTRRQPRQPACKDSAVKELDRSLLIIRQSFVTVGNDYFPGVTSTAAYVSGTAASGDSTRNVKLCCKYSSTEVLVWSR